MDPASATSKSSDPISREDGACSRSIVTFDDHDYVEATKWSTRRKCLVVIVGFLLVVNSTLGSSLSSGAVQYFQIQFHISNTEQLVLPNSMYLLGYVFGPPLFSPLSEMIGRQIVLQASFFLFTSFTLASALAPTWPSLIIFRLLTGIFASAPISVVGGLYADIFDDPVYRGRAVAVLVGSTTIAPVLGPIISGFVSPVSWRWTFWIALIVAGACWPAVLVLPETFGPIILVRKAKALRKKGRSSNAFAPIELQERPLRDVVLVTLARPMRLLAEPIVLASCLYLAFEYALFYMFFVAYPIIFQGTYGMTAAVANLPLIPVGIGAGIACVISVLYDGVLRRATQRKASWAQCEEYRRLPLACVGGPLHVISLFWLGWTARKEVHWIVPTLAGLPFGIGVELTFISLLNYMADAYKTYSASAMASSAFTRSIFAVLLPLCTDKMYRQLGVSWATSLLGFVSLVMSCAPFLLIRYGDWMRRNSKFCQELTSESGSEMKTQEITGDSNTERHESGKEIGSK